LCFAAGCAPKAESTTSEQAPPDPTPSDPSPSEPVNAEPTQPEPTPPSSPLSFEDATANTIQATITMEDGGVIVLELYPDLAPQSVFNFVHLARQGFYDGLSFHRIMKDFMIQGGCPLGTGTGNPGYSIKGEFEDNGFPNNLSHTSGVISMARGDNFDSAGSQFFIVHGNASFLDGSYAAFGRVTSGMDVVDRLANTPNSGPNGAVAEVDRPVIRTITIDDDVELPEPYKIK